MRDSINPKKLFPWAHGMDQSVLTDIGMELLLPYGELRPEQTLSMRCAALLCSMLSYSFALSALRFAALAAQLHVHARPV